MGGDLGYAFAHNPALIGIYAASHTVAGTIAAPIESGLTDLLGVSAELAHEIAWIIGWGVVGVIGLIALWVIIKVILWAVRRGRRK